MPMALVPPAVRAACPECHGEVGVAHLTCPGCGFEPPVLEMLSAPHPEAGTRPVHAVWPGTWVVGRSRSSDVVLRDRSVSRRHARVIHDRSGALWIEDAGGTNGVTVGGEQLAPSARRALGAGDIVHVGRVGLRVVVGRTDELTTEQLAPHEIRWPLRDGDTRDAAVLALDQLQLALILLRPDATVLLANRAARALLDAREGLALERGRLRCRDPRAQGELHELLRPEANRAGALTVPREGRRPLFVLVSRLETGCATRAVFLSDPEQGLERVDEWIARHYGLTTAETRVAGELLQGRTLEESASQLGVTVHTARTHLRRIFDKTGTRRQSELLLLLLRGTSQVRPSS